MIYFQAFSYFPFTPSIHLTPFIAYLPTLNNSKCSQLPRCLLCSHSTCSFLSLLPRPGSSVSGYDESPGDHAATDAADPSAAGSFPPAAPGFAPAAAGRNVTAGTNTLRLICVEMPKFKSFLLCIFSFIADIYKHMVAWMLYSYLPHNLNHIQYLLTTIKVIASYHYVECIVSQKHVAVYHSRTCPLITALCPWHAYQEESDIDVLIRVTSN